MAKTTETCEKQDTVEVEKQEDRVEVTIPRGQANDDPNFFVSVNGVNYLLPRGETSMVPRHIAEEIRRSFEAEREQDKHIASMMEASK